MGTTLKVGSRRLAGRRRVALRVLIMAALVAACVLAFLGVRHAIVLPVVGDGPVGDVLSLIVPVAFTAVTAPHVSYRAVDALAWIVPLLGLILFLKIAWRLSLLPYRDWPPRPDEVSRCKRLSPDDSLYVRD